MWYDLKKVGQDCKANTTDRIEDLERKLNDLISYVNTNMRGPAGPQGPRGEKGDKGQQGIQGHGLRLVHKVPIGLPYNERIHSHHLDEMGDIVYVEADNEFWIKGTNGNIHKIPQHQGPKGDKGDPGTSVRILGTYPDSSQLPQHNNTPGDGYLVKEDLWVWTGAQWVNAGRIQGPKGEQGDKGDTGDRGPKGDRGEKGDAGLNGKDGKDGINGTPGPAGPVGPRGDRGPIGPQGATGPVGNSGPKGDKGDRGDTGAVGPKGDIGNIGPTGPQGPAGRDGRDSSYEVKTMPGNWNNNIDNAKTSGIYKSLSTTLGTWPQGFPSAPALQRDAILEVSVHTNNQFIFQTLSIIRGANTPWQNSKFTRCWDGNRWYDWKRLNTGEGSVTMFGYIADANEYKPGNSGPARTNASTQNLPSGCSWGTISFIPENTANPPTGGTQQYTPNSGSNKGSMYIRALEGGNWSDWKKLSEVDLSPYATNTHVNATFYNKHDIDFKLSNIASGQHSGNNGYYKIGQNLMLEWQVITRPNAGVSPHGAWEKIVTFQHISELYTFSVANDISPNTGWDDSILQTRYENARSIKVRSNKGGNRIRVIGIGRSINY